MRMMYVYPFGYIPYRMPNTDRSFQAGDVLVASDNLGGLPPGYMGHSAIVVDSQHIVEATDEDPIVRKASIQQFLDYHPIHAHFRPLYPQMGYNAARYAEWFVQQFQHNTSNGSNHLQFSLFTSQPLEDGSQFIYCSKLVWLCYFYGARYRFPNDFLWFSPEDLATTLSNDPNFISIYANPNFGFKIDL